MKFSMSSIVSCSSVFEVMVSGCSSDWTAGWGFSGAVSSTCNIISCKVHIFWEGWKMFQKNKVRNSFLREKMMRNQKFLLINSILNNSIYHYCRINEVGSIMLILSKIQILNLICGQFLARDLNLWSISFYFSVSNSIFANFQDPQKLYFKSKMAHIFDSWPLNVQ